jgi:ferredoxin
MLQGMGVRVRVDSSGCLSSGRCVAAAPDVFSFDADRLAQAAVGETALALEDAVVIARACPALVIEVLGEDGEALDL